MISLVHQYVLINEIEVHVENFFLFRGLIGYLYSEWTIVCVDGSGTKVEKEIIG